MKKFKFLAVLMILAVLPLVGVKAEEYNAYTAGTIRNFYTNDDEKQAGSEGSTDVGVYAVILEDSDSSSKYVRAMAHHIYYGSEKFDAATFKTSSNYRQELSEIETLGITDPYLKIAAENDNLDLISLQELIDVFGATYDEATETYSIDAATWGSTFQEFCDEIAAQQNAYELVNGTGTGGLGFYTNTVTDGNVWTVKFGVNPSTYDITSITVEKVALTATEPYATVPVLYFNKTYDCKYTQKQSYACYSCNEEYAWTEVGTQAESCSLVDTINTQADCVTPVKTGIEDYSLQLLAVVGAGALALIILKRKSLFKQN